MFGIKMRIKSKAKIVLSLVVTIGHLCLMISADQNVIRANVNKCCPPGEYLNNKDLRCEKYKKMSVGDGSGFGAHWNVPEEFIHNNGTKMEMTWTKVKYTPGCPHDLVTKLLSVNDAFHQYSFTDHGILLELPGDDNSSRMAAVNYQTNEYCVDPTLKGMVLRLCPAHCNEDELCFRKCCPLGQHLSYHDKEHKQGKCVPSPGDNVSDTWHLPLYAAEAPHRIESGSRILPRYESLYPIENDECYSLSASTGWKFPQTNSAFKMLSNGTILFLNSDESKRWERLTHLTDYCYDRGAAHKSLRHAACEDEIEILFFCTHYPEEGEWEDEEVGEDEHGDHHHKDHDLKWFLGILANITLPTAIICLSLATIITFLITDKGNLHSWTRLSFVMSELLLLLLFAVVHHTNVEEFPELCRVVGIFFHYSGLMTMCWLSVMNFDLWWTFQVLQSSSSRKFDIRRFCYYTCVALGVPLLIVSIAVGIDTRKPLEEYDHICRDQVEWLHNNTKDPSSSSSSPSSSAIYPRYGEASCSLAQDSLGTYWYGPLCFLLLSNLFFFLATTFRMARLRKMTRRASVDSTHGATNSRQVFIKIMIVSGVTWNVELIGWIFQLSRFRLDIVHHLQAVALFVIFVCKKEVFRNLRVKYPYISKFLPPIPGVSRSATLHSASTEYSSSRTFARKASIASTNSSRSARSFRRQDSLELSSTSTNFASIALS